MDHDCINHDCLNYAGPRKQDGVECYGYMDYNDNTNGWSPCSVADLTLYMNTMGNEFCLTALGKELKLLDRNLSNENLY